MSRLFFYAINYATIILSSYAIPIDQIGNVQPELDTPNSQPWNRPDFVPKLLISAFLIIAGGVCAGLTIGLMGQDQVFLQVLERSGDVKTRRYASKLLKLLSKGRHWILITLLMLNVIVNETLPIVFDSVLGGGWPAVVISTVSIVIFGEIIPQALCVRYGLAIGSYFSPVVLMLMYLLYPIAKPTALLLDYLLGHHEGSVYGKKGLKTLVALHENIGIEKLDKDEVTIISSVLDLKAKAVESIMTPMKDVYTMPYDKILDQEAIDEILSQGFSRIPIYRPENKTDFVGMLLVKLLITYDPEDQWPVSRFALATLPETSASVSCLDILNFFQQGKSHMVLVSAHPGEGYGALGVLTLEDVIEELIGEEIIDETDVYIDVHKGLRRLSTPLLLNSGSRPITNVKPGALHRAATAAVHNFQKSLSQASPQQQSQMLSVSPGTIPYDQGAHKTQFILNPRNQAMNPTPYVNAKFVIKKPEDFISKPHHTVKEPVEDLIAFEERDEIDAESSRSDNH